MVKVCLRGKCKNIQLSANNGQPARCLIDVELDYNVSQEYHLYDVRLLVPVEFATLLEVGLQLTLTLEQNEN